MNERIENYQSILNGNAIFGENVIEDIYDLRIFTQFHVYAVWDFMSLVKSLQHHICPSGHVWVPDRRKEQLSGLINDIVCAEESDTLPDGTRTSHFELYRRGMRQIGADTRRIDSFIESLQENKKLSLNQLLMEIPEAAQTFCNKTFEFVFSDKPHVIAAALCYGRETVIPSMFKRLIEQIGFAHTEASMFKYYLDRHIDIDGDQHGPAAEQLVSLLCDNDPIKVKEAQDAAIEALQYRIDFWNQVTYVIESIKRLMA